MLNLLCKVRINVTNVYFELVANDWWSPVRQMGRSLKEQILYMHFIHTLYIHYLYIPRFNLLSKNGLRTRNPKSELIMK